MVLVLLMALVLLSVNHVERKNVKQQCESGGSRYTKQAAPPVHWLEDLAKRRGLGHLLQPQQREQSSAANAPKRGVAQCQAIVKIRKGKESRGILTPWTKEERYLGNFYTGSADAAAMCDAWSVVAEKRMLLQPPLEVDCPIRFRFDFWAPQTALTWEEVCRSSRLTRKDITEYFEVSEETVTDFSGIHVVCGCPSFRLNFFSVTAGSTLYSMGACFMPGSNLSAGRGPCKGS